MKYALLVPAVLLFAVFVAWPLVELVRLSLTETDFITTQFVGLANYAAAFKDRAFLLSVANSAVYMVLMIAMSTGGALLIVLLVVDARKRWHDAARLVFYVPMLSAGVIIAQVWRWLFHINGPINWLLGTDIAWFARPVTGLPAVAFIVSATAFGGGVIMLLSSALAINPELYDAARIDGATRLQQKLRITVPLIAPMLGVMALLAAVQAPQVFETIYALAPYEHTATMTFHIYRSAFQMSRYGTAAAQALVLMLLTGGLAWAKQKLTPDAA